MSVNYTDPMVASIAKAIIRQEGATQNNNPGNLRNWNPNLPKDSRGFDIFPTYQDGLDALQKQIALQVNRGQNLFDFFAQYAPSSDGNNQVLYAQHVASWTGLDPNVPLIDQSAPVSYQPNPTSTDSVSISDILSAATADFPAINVQFGGLVPEGVDGKTVLYILGGLVALGLLKKLAK